MVSGVWVMSRHFRPSEWARMQEMGFAGGGGDEGLWGSMGGGGVSDGEGGASTTTAPTPPPSQAAPPPPTALKETKVVLRVRVAERRHGDPPWQKAQTPRPHPQCMAYEGRHRPQTPPPPRPPPPIPPRPDQD